jgi:hypothetical protein
MAELRGAESGYEISVKILEGVVQIDYIVGSDWILEIRGSLIVLLVIVDKNRDTERNFAAIGDQLKVMELALRG